MITNRITPLSVFFAGIGIVAIGTIVTGRHPRWLQAPLDRWEANRRQLRARD
jgi:hypothetical protein